MHIKSLIYLKVLLSLIKAEPVTQARKLFNKGDVVQQTVEPSNYQYDLKTEPETEDVYDKEELKTIVKEGPKIVPKKKPVLNTVSANQVYNYLINEKGLDKNKSLGILANIYAESNFKMDADEAGDGESRYRIISTYLFYKKKRFIRNSSRLQNKLERSDRLCIVRKRS